MLTTLQREALDAQGWVLLPSVVSAEALRELQRWAEEQLKATGHDTESLVFLPNAVRDHLALNQWMLSGPLGAIGRAALGAQSVRLLQDGILHKPAQCPDNVPWHCDHTYLGYLVPPRVVSVRVALTSASEQTGCLKIRPGSHRWATPNLAAGATRIDDHTPFLQSIDTQDIDEHPVVMAAGDVSIHLCRLWHGSGPNESDAPRTVLVFHIADAACVVDRDAIPPSLVDAITTDDAGRLSAPSCPRL